jgi:prolyl-tRNA synthetase
MDLIGLPWRITVGPRGLAKGRRRAHLPPHRRERGDERGAAVARVADIYSRI